MQENNEIIAIIVSSIKTLETIKGKFKIQNPKSEFHNQKIINADRFCRTKGHVLTRSTLKCLSQVASINPTLGCIHQCAYCYARGYSIYPGDGKVFIYGNMPEKLKRIVRTPKVTCLCIF